MELDQPSCQWSFYRETSLYSPADKHFAPPRIGNTTAFEAGVLQKAQPGIPGENPENVSVVYDSNRSPCFAQQIREIDGISVVGWVRIESPFDVTNTPAIAGSAVVTPVGCQRNKRLLNHIRHKQSNTSRLAMTARGLERT